MYYFDRFAKEIVTEKDNCAPPERYHEYKRGTEEGVLIETYITQYEPLVLVDFSYLITDLESSAIMDLKREAFLAENDIKRMVSYTLPPSEYDKMICEMNQNEDDDYPTCSAADIVVDGPSDLHQKYAIMMQEIVDRGGKDPEYDHDDADGVLCQLLEELGFGDIVDIYNIEKFYA